MQTIKQYRGYAAEVYPLFMDFPQTLKTYVATSSSPKPFAW